MNRIQSAKKAVEVDIKHSPIDLRVTARYRDAGDLDSLVLFDTRQDELQTEVAAGDYLANRGPIERTVLLNLYPPIRKRKRERLEQKMAHAANLMQTRGAKTDSDRRLLARVLIQEGQLVAFRGDYIAALKNYDDADKSLGPLIFNPKRIPARDDADPLFQLRFHSVVLLIRARKFEETQSRLANLSALVDRMIGSQPEEPDYLRWRAQSFLLRTYCALGTGSEKEAGDSLQRYLDMQRDLDHRVATSGTKRELVEAVENARQLCKNRSSRRVGFLSVGAVEDVWGTSVPIGHPCPISSMLS